MRPQRSPKRDSGLGRGWRAWPWRSPTVLDFGVVGLRRGPARRPPRPGARSARSSSSSLDAVPDDAAAAIVASRCERLDRAFETVEHVTLLSDHDFHRLVVLVAAHLTLGHVHLRGQTPSSPTLRRPRRKRIRDNYGCRCRARRGRRRASRWACRRHSTSRACFSQARIARIASPCTPCAPSAVPSASSV